MDPVNILIAEDEPEVREVLRTVIATDAGLRLVGAAEEAETAIELASRHRPDVALVDVRMPGGGGLRATREILARSPDTRVVAFSAFEDVETVLAMLKAGARFYVSKSDSTEEILQAIHRAVEDDGEDRTDIERVVVALDAWRGHRTRNGSLDELRTERIRSALEPDEMRIELLPICDLGSGDPVGWQASPRLTTIERSWSAMLADARSVGMLPELELASVALALEHVRDVPGDDWMCVSVSPETARSSELIGLLDGADVARLVLALNDPNPAFGRAGVERSMRRWREAGVRVGIQDVGCGTDTLRLFVRIQPELIWLDPVLAAGVEEDRSRQRLVEGLVSIATDLGATLIATGVGSRSAAEALSGLGVELGQDDGSGATTIVEDMGAQA
jgi:DNA-binding NarL/FixJ family response regulator/EAL domain-containing protein (putative c-di-GMP-specific phosphodiesterase class I)